MKAINKFMIIFGIFWMLISVAVLVPLLIAFNGTEDFFGLLALSIPFLAIGIVFLVIGFSSIVKKNKYLKKGTSYYGKIVAYETDGTVMINNRPLVIVQVRYFDRNGRINTVSVSTGSNTKSGYNLGETVQIAEYNGKTILISDRSQNTRLQGEETLIMTYNTGAESITQIRPESYTCPHCGANLMIARGQTVKCPYCDSYVTNERKWA
ncbi:MAG: hypothetical protein K6G87_11130 [Butyrivibrio sp.]|uniref:hypothetical protein n=1 Tax=Butyrivibrio sp. TaxID=28121 RepID=UPI0025FC7EC2|nr:hypothetical protein [Butyrivibrio sp.]MCR5771765.1 hypothetical protein [Butyrivibrio sp.]